MPVRQWHTIHIRHDYDACIRYYAKSGTSGGVVETHLEELARHILVPIPSNARQAA